MAEVNVEAFDEVYAQEHATMVNEKVPNVARWTASKVVGTPTGDPPPYHLVAELYFPSVEALQEALGTEGGQETAAHAVSISTGDRRFCWSPRKRLNNVCVASRFVHVRR